MIENATKNSVLEEIAKAKTAEAYEGRSEGSEHNAAKLCPDLIKGMVWSEIQKATGCSRSTLSRLRERVNC